MRIRLFIAGLVLCSGSVSQAQLLNPPQDFAQQKAEVAQLERVATLGTLITQQEQKKQSLLRRFKPGDSKVLAVNSRLRKLRKMLNHAQSQLNGQLKQRKPQPRAQLLSG